MATSTGAARKAGWEEPRIRTELPGPESLAMYERLDRFVTPVHRNHDDVPFVVASKRGSILEDVDGNTFADHCAAWGSTPLGADPPQVVEAVIDAQRRYGMEISNYAPSEIVVELAERLVQIAPPGITRVAYEISGTTAVEAGVKLAREATGRPMILTFYGQYHGESTYLTAGASTDLASVPTQNAQYVPGIVFAPYPNPYRAPFHRGAGPFDEGLYLDYLEEWILVHQVEPEQIAGVLIEPVLGEGGIIAPGPRFWARLKTMCRRWGWVLILDEVQTCMGRCGTMFAAERLGIEPDILLLAKGFAGGGQPIAAVMATEDILGDTSLHLGGTFAWTPAAAAGALANIDAIVATGALDDAMRIEQIALDELGPLVGRHEQVGQVRAVGAYIGVEFVQDKDSIRPAPAFHRAVHRNVVRRGVLGITEWGKWVYRMQPAINMHPELFRWSCQALAGAIDDVAEQPPEEAVSLLELGEVPD